MVMGKLKSRSSSCIHLCREPLQNILSNLRGFAGATEDTVIAIHAPRCAETRGATGMRQRERFVQREGQMEGGTDRGREEGSEGGSKGGTEHDKSKLEQSKRFWEDNPRHIKFCCTCLI